nr:hypothetical protein [Ruegeria sp. WL0004]
MCCGRETLRRSGRRQHRPDIVATPAAIEEIVALAAEQEIIVHAARDHVIAGAASDGITAKAAAERVIAIHPVNIVGEVDLWPIRSFVRHDLVVSSAAKHRIGSVAMADLVIAVAAVQDGPEGRRSGTDGAIQDVIASKPQKASALALQGQMVVLLGARLGHAQPVVLDQGTVHQTELPDAVDPGVPGAVIELILPVLRVAEPDEIGKVIRGNEAHFE